MIFLKLISKVSLPIFTLEWLAENDIIFCHLSIEIYKENVVVFGLL